LTEKGVLLILAAIPKILTHQKMPWGDIFYEKEKDNRVYGNYPYEEDWQLMGHRRQR